MITDYTKINYSFPIMKDVNSYSYIYIKNLQFYIIFMTRFL